MGIRLAAILALVPILLFAALVAAMPSPATALQPVMVEPGLPLPSLRVEYSAGRVTLSGVVPDRAERDTIVRQASALYGRDRVDDRLTIGAVANPAWLSPAFLPDLKELSSAVAVLEDAHLVVTGIAQSIEVHERWGARLRGLMHRGVHVVDHVAVAAQR
jgi:BON domain